MPCTRSPNDVSLKIGSQAHLPHEENNFSKRSANLPPPFDFHFSITTDRMIEAGVGFGVAEHSVKALQIALSGDSLGGGLDKDGRLHGYDISFNFRRERVLGEFGHFYDGKRVGLWLGPDGPHEGNHQASCQAKFRGISRCPQLTGINATFTSKITRRR